MNEYRKIVKFIIYFSMSRKKWVVQKAPSWIWTSWTWKEYKNIYIYKNVLLKNFLDFRKLMLHANLLRNYKLKRKNYYNQIHQHVRKWQQLRVLVN